MWFRRAQTHLFLGLALIALSTPGCTQVSGFLPDLDLFSRTKTPPETADPIERVEIFRRAETERAKDLTREIERLQTDLRKAEAALIQAESGLSAKSTRADAISSLAVARIGVERAARRAPWRRREIEVARKKLEEAERQVSDGRFGAALFFVYRAQRCSETLLEEADIVDKHLNVRAIKARRVNVRAGPSTEDPILIVIEAGTPVFPKARQDGWVLLQVSGGPTGWIHEDLIGPRLPAHTSGPASPRP